MGQVFILVVLTGYIIGEMIKRCRKEAARSLFHQEDFPMMRAMRRIRNSPEPERGDETEKKSKVE